MGEFELGPMGMVLDVADDRAHLERAAEAERLGFSALWVPGGQLETLEPLVELLRATQKATVAPGIMSLDVHGAADVVRLFDLLADREAERLVAGFGGPQQAARPLAAMRQFLDELDAAPAAPVPAARRLIAALGPRKLELARERAAGAITMLVTPGYTEWARSVLGPDATLVVQQLVVLDSDVDSARRTVRGPLSFLLGPGVGGYAANMRRMGFGDDDITGLSDDLVDAVATIGDAEAIVAAAQAHLAAGADHVALSVLSDGRQPGQIEVARAVATAMRQRPVRVPAPGVNVPSREGFAGRRRA
ncbi:putative F420-dependent oxidoreductase, MSMEG_4141 family [Promicromonospora umidemergens]|uniref:LLM class F420-dependent oxidoreductase n=1 Tax=Promicromonospora umidemergens TaxID=629679 RepID=A0ABP8Y6P8_9MICO|nr:TIGR03620 family F420-dependent LLM class oxidoreductase [Promicromonospora umidemergens]MCP2282344.1 putative F420-dependent oxidoreductase, MSMEG_4141 family [Promicromonospora umidemergens]